MTEDRPADPAASPRRERAGTLEDLEALCTLDARCFARPWMREHWQEEVRREQSEVRIIEVGQGDAVAAACWFVIDDVAEIRRVAARPDARREGLGRQLVASVVDRARARGCVRLDLEVAGGNAPAIGLYRAMGFEQVGRRPGYYRDPPDDALLFSLDLRRT